MTEFALQPPEPDQKATRRKLDAYYTPPILTQALIDEFPEICGNVLADPCSGDGRMSEQLIRAGRFKSAIVNDIAAGGLDATRAESWMTWKGADWVVTNIPFVHSGTIPWRAIEAGIPAALLMRITFLEPVEDRQWLLRCPPTAMLALPRVSFTGTGATDSTTCAWFIWAPIRPRVRIAGRVPAAQGALPL